MKMAAILVALGLLTLGGPGQARHSAARHTRTAVRQTARHTARVRHNRRTRSAARSMGMRRLPPVPVHRPNERVEGRPSPTQTDVRYPAPFQPTVTHRVKILKRVPTH